MQSFEAVSCSPDVMRDAAGRAAAQTSQNSLDQVVDKIVTQENADMQKLHQYSPLVETYIQQMRPDDKLGTVPNGDKYFLGRAELAKGVELEPLTTEQQGAGSSTRCSAASGTFSLSRWSSCRAASCR